MEARIELDTQTGQPKGIIFFHKDMLSGHSGQLIAAEKDPKDGKIRVQGMTEEEWHQHDQQQAITNLSNDVDADKNYLVQRLNPSEKAVLKDLIAATFNGDASKLARIAQNMLALPNHGQGIINAYSGIVPSDYSQFELVAGVGGTMRLRYGDHYGPFVEIDSLGNSRVSSQDDMHDTWNSDTMNPDLVRHTMNALARERLEYYEKSKRTP